MLPAMNPEIDRELQRIKAMAAAEAIYKNSTAMNFDIAKRVANRITADSKARDISLYQEASEKGIYPWELMELWDPSPRNLQNDIITPLDAMERLMFVLNQPIGGSIMTDQFISGSAAILLPSLLLRWITEGMAMGFGEMGVFAASRKVTGLTITPLYLEGEEQQNVARAPSTSSGGKRLGASAKSGLPRTIVSYRDKDVKLGVFGRVLDFGYEVVKYASLDELRLIFLFIGLQIAYDDIGNIFEVIDVGDTVSGAPPTRLQISGAGGAGVLVWNDVVSAMVEMMHAAPFRVTHWIGEANSIKDLLTLSQFTGANWRETLIEKLFGGEQRGPIKTVIGTLLCSPNPPADVDHLGFFDKMFAVCKGEESPLQIETDKIISMRWEEAAVSGTWAFWKFAGDSSGMVDYSA